jgi:3-hydroxyacyl-[acyl-carrier-protein] dehydratase
MRWIFLDRILSIEAGVEASGLKMVAAEADHFREHFPDFPVMPGVLILEALAQLSGKLLEVTLLRDQHIWVWPIISMMDKVKFKKLVRPGDVIHLHTRLLDLRDESARCQVRALVEGKVVTTAEQIFVFNPEGLDTDEGRQKLALHEGLALSILWKGWADFSASLPKYCLCGMKPDNGAPR